MSTVTFHLLRDYTSKLSFSHENRPGLERSGGRRTPRDGNGKSSVERRDSVVVFLEKTLGTVYFIIMYALEKGSWVAEGEDIRWNLRVERREWDGRGVGGKRRTTHKIREGYTRFEFL